MTTTISSPATTGSTPASATTNPAIAGGPLARWDHWAFVVTTIHLVHDRGAAEALQRLRPLVRDRGVPGHGADGPHETLLVFYVWAVDRLLAAGLSTTHVMWHPLIDARSPLAWYSASVLDSDEAREHFVASDRALLREPAPHPPLVNHAIAG